MLMLAFDPSHISITCCIPGKKHYLGKTNPESISLGNPPVRSGLGKCEVC